MLPAAHRLRRSVDFTAVVGSGRRVRAGAVVVHYLAAATDGEHAARVGLIVGRGVGGSVIRHQVSRRLRAQLAMRLERFEPGSATVVRALPDAARADSDGLGRDLDRALRRLVSAAPLSARPSARPPAPSSAPTGTEPR